MISYPPEIRKYFADSIFIQRNFVFYYIFLHYQTQDRICSEYPAPEQKEAAGGSLFLSYRILLILISYL